MEIPTTPQRIAMLSVHTCPLATLGGKKTGGMNVYIRDLSEEFTRQGIAVDIYTRSQDPCQPHINDSLAHNARVIHIPTGPESPLETTEVYPYLPEFVEGVLAYVAQHNIQYDLIFSHYWLSGWAAHELRATWQIPVVQMFHTLGHMKNRIAQTPTPESTIRDIRVFTETDIMSWADALIAATPAERAQMLWLYQADRRKIHIVPPGVNVDHFHPINRQKAKAAIGIPHDHPMFLFVGRIERLKGVDNILKAIEIVNGQCPRLGGKAKYIIVGGNLKEANDLSTEMGRLKSMYKALDLGAQVSFLGARDQDRLRYYYNAAEALIMPSDYESFGMVALEAMACGTPVIASEVGGLAYLIKDGITGYHVPVREPAILAEKILQLLQNPEQQRQMGVSAQATAEHYAWPVIAQRLSSVFANVLAGIPNISASLH